MLKKRIIPCLDVKNGRVVKGINFVGLKDVKDYGVSRLIYTDIDRDGTKNSPNFEETIKIADASNCPVIISGGVSSINDIKKAKELSKKMLKV